MSFLKQAFETVVTDAVYQDEVWYVILMENVPYYGGPEEGGWWGNDSIVVGYKQCISEEIANKLKEKVEEFAKELNEDSKKEYGEHCLRSMEWLDERGLDADFLPEPDGPSEYYVRVSQRIPENSYGTRGYS